MAMLEINILDFIPQELRQQAQDTLVDFVSEQAKKFVSDGVADKLKQLRTDGAFRKQFDKGLNKALKRFADEYYEKDEDLVDAIVQEKDLFKSPDVKQALMTMLKSPGSYLADEGDIVAQTFDSVLPGRKNRERVNKAMLYLLRCLVEELWHLPELQPVYSLQFQKVTAEAMKQQVELQKVQIKAMVDINEGVRQALLQLTDAIGQQKRLPSGELASQTPVIKHNLPQPEYERFIGREKELEQILELLSSKSRHFLISIDGVGGIGKSSLALEVATHYLLNTNSLEKSDRFEAIIWVSAKKTVLTPDGVVSRVQTHRTLDDIYQTIAITLENELITKASPEKQIAIVRNALSKQRTLLVIDNFETIDDEKVVSFLLELPQPTKSVITTRSSFSSAYSISLTGMKSEEAIAFIEQECSKKQITLEDSQKQRLFKRTGGVPLAMSWCVAQVGAGYPIESVLTRLGIPNNDVALFSFKGSLDIVQPDPVANALLLSLSLFATSATREALGKVAGCAENILDRDDGLAKLEKLSLINGFQGRFSMLPLTKEFVAFEFNNNPLKDILLGRWKNWVVDYVKQYGGESWDWRGFQKIDLEIDNIIVMLEQGIEHGWNDALVVLRYITYYMKISGRWNESNRQSEDALILARKYNDHKAIAMIATHSLGWTYAQQGNLKKAEKYAEQGLEASLRENDLYAIASAKRVLGQIHRKQDKFVTAKAYYDDALRLALEIGDTGLIGNITGELGKLAIDQGRYEEGRTLLEKSLNILDGIEEDRLIYGALSGHLANLNYITGHLIDAERLGLKCLSIYDEIGGVTDVSLTLARIYKQQNKIEEAKAMCIRSIDLFDKLGMINELEQAKSLLTTIN